MPATGQKKPFTAAQVAALRERLTLMRDYKCLALLNVAVDTLLRAGDLVSLRVADVLGKAEFSIIQEKTRTPVTCALLPGTLESLETYVRAYRLAPSDRLFGFTELTLSRQVKTWARILGEDPRFYAAHSLRRTKSAHMAEECTAAQLDQIRRLLGHAYISTTQAYLGNDTRKSLDFARSNAI